MLLQNIVVSWSLHFNFVILKMIQIASCTSQNEEHMCVKGKKEGREGG